MNQENGKRLNKFISESGFCSRRAADKLIENGDVTINGKLPELGTKVMPDDNVSVKGKRIHAMPENKSDRIYIAYNKPTGITCTTERNVRGNIIDAINHRERIFPIGRLDKPSEGLIFLTSDGDIVNKILRAENAHDKEYVVTVNQPVSERFIDRMGRGVPILGTITKECKVEVVSKFVFKIVLTQGLNRQIRRMCEYLGYEVVKLKRTRIMSVSLDQLRPGQWRNLNYREMQEINDAVADSKKTAPELTEETTRAVKKAPKHTASAISSPYGNFSVKTYKVADSESDCSGSESNHSESSSSRSAYESDRPKPKYEYKPQSKKGSQSEDATQKDDSKPSSKTLSLKK